MVKQSISSHHKVVFTTVHLSGYLVNLPLTIKEHILVKVVQVGISGPHIRLCMLRSNQSLTRKVIELEKIFRLVSSQIIRP